ncbi:hypothetical protein BDN70DRAFT_936096 [Pholiota conissans]|uniref:Uncharacterized protein n=1 Tax=Pholiota conissans TaxID=109636 RepID=A0A9P5YTF8_9AGAR|nr:hypothetical protein BDN70DRAFT_936096 [Pholiota conissans]
MGVIIASTAVTVAIIGSGVVYFGGIKACAKLIARRIMKIMLRKALGGAPNPADLITNGVKPVTQAVSAIADHLPTPINPADILAAKPVSNAVAAIADHVPNPVNVVQGQAKAVSQTVSAITEHIPTPVDVIQGQAKAVTQTVSGITEHIPTNPADVLSGKPVTNAVASIAERVPITGEAISNIAPTNWLGKGTEQLESNTSSWATGPSFLKKRTGVAAK